MAPAYTPPIHPTCFIPVTHTRPDTYVPLRSRFSHSYDYMPLPGGIELAGQMRASGLNRSTPIAIITEEEDRTALTDASRPEQTSFYTSPSTAIACFV